MQNAADITVEAYIAAFQALEREGRISENQRVILRTHYRAPECVTTANQLAKAVSYQSHNGVNLWYGKLGKWVAEEVGYQPPEGYTFLSTLVTFEREATPYPMKLRPNVTQALQVMGWDR